MPPAKDIAEYLEDQLIGTVGTNIFVGRLPETPDTCIALYDYGGSPPDLCWEGDYPSLQVRVRDDDYLTGWTTANTIKTTLHNLTYQTIETHLYYHIRARHDPEYMGRDANDNVEFVINFEIIKERET